MTLGRKARKAAGRKRLTYIYNAAPLFIRHRCKFNASVLSFRAKQKLSCKTATVTFSFPCLRAWSSNKGLQWVSYEPKWNVSAIQSHTLKRVQLGHGPRSPVGSIPVVWQRWCPKPCLSSIGPPVPRTSGFPPWAPTLCVKTGLSLLFLNGAGTWPLLCQNRSRAVPGGKWKAAFRFPGMIRWPH